MAKLHATEKKRKTPNQLTILSVKYIFQSAQQNGTQQNSNGL